MRPSPLDARRPLLLALAAVAGSVLLSTGSSAGSGSPPSMGPAVGSPSPTGPSVRALSPGPSAAAPAPAAPSPAAPAPAAPLPAASFPAAQATPSPLREPGSGAFAAVREVVAELEARPETDWSRVDLERLRGHLADMHRFTLQAEVVGRRDVEGGLETTVRGATPEADAAVRGAVQAHAPFLAEETGWEVSVEETEDGVTLHVTAGDRADAEKIRGLGYIGLMAKGSHHTEHHWAIATGGMPHGHGGGEGRGGDGHGHDDPGADDHGGQGHSAGGTAGR